MGMSTGYCQQRVCRERVELNGAPLHPLVVHAVVVLGPLTALTGLAYAAVRG